MLLNCGVGEDLRVLWTAKRSNQSILKEINPEYSLEELMLTPILWPPDVKSWLIRKDPDAGKDWRWEEKGPTEDKMVGWHHQLNGHEFEQAPEVGKGQGSLACCSPWGSKESDTTEQLNSNNHIFFHSGSTNSVKEFQFSMCWPTLILFSFCIIAILTDVRWYLTVVWSAFPWRSVMESIFAYTCQPFAYLHWRNVYST